LSESEKPKKVRDNRPHDERFTALSIAFAECKAAAYASGMVNDCSASKVLLKSGVQRKYLYGKEIKDKTVREKYHKYAKDIKEFRDEFQGNKGTDKEHTALTEANIIINELTIEKEEAQAQGASYLTQVQRLKQQLSLNAEAHNNLINQQTYAAHTHQTQPTASVIPVNFTETVVVSPDRHLYVKGKYSFHDQNVVDAAWRISKDELKKALSQQQQTRVYMLVGPPCSGKSYWVKNPDLYPGAYRPIIIDACNLTQAERHKWFRIIEKSQNDYKVCAVYFDTPLAELFSRNNQRNPDKKMPDAEIENKFKSLEMVNLFEEEFIDEIKVVRHATD
jgi:hypothetical protein